MPIESSSSVTPGGQSRASGREVAQGGEIAAGASSSALQAGHAHQPADGHVAIAGQLRPARARSPRRQTMLGRFAGDVDFQQHGKRTCRPAHILPSTAASSRGCRPNGSSPPAAASGGPCSAASGRSCASGPAIGQRGGLLPKLLRPALAQVAQPASTSGRTTSADTYLVTATSVTSPAGRPLRGSRRGDPPADPGTFSAIRGADINEPMQVDLGDAHGRQMVLVIAFAVSRISGQLHVHGHWKAGRTTSAAGRAGPTPPAPPPESFPSPRPPPGRVGSSR